MDFQVLTDTPRPPSVMDSLERVLSSGLQAWQKWTQNPPHLMGFLVWVLVSLEFTLNFHMVNELGFSLLFFKHWLVLFLAIGLVEYGLALVASQVGEFFGKPGSMMTLVTFLNIGLIPLFIYLPFSLISWLSGKGHSARLLLLMLLMVKVLVNWRAAAETVHKFSKLQSAVTIYVSSAVALILLVVWGYVSLLSRISQLFS